ncbi:MAG TPA: electron transfer flavoprotein subunit alpha/FixB family protein [Dehalococcoidia bacterium]|nr:electron transfer flavoprotein subunit alpha/FixB family protein [Dehalococcoidia bacterium]
MSGQDNTAIPETSASSAQNKSNGNGICFIAEHKDGKLEDSSLLLAAEARSIADNLDEDVAALIIGHGIRDLAQGFRPYGVDKAFVFEDKLLETYSPEFYVDVMSQLIGPNKPSVILFATSPLSNDLAPRLAARLKVGLVSRYTQMEKDSEGKLLVHRHIHGGKARVTLTPLKKPMIASVDPQMLTLQKAREAKDTQIIEPPIRLSPRLSTTRVTDFIKADPCAVCVSEAEVVIGVGKGLGCAENLNAVDELARIIGGSIGGSRRATDEHWIVDERRIGLTGKTITPTLYLVCGISGAFHHTLSIKGSKLILSINTDKNAPITKMADLAIVGDMHAIIPELTRQLREIMKPTT